MEEGGIRELFSYDLREFNYLNIRGLMKMIMT